MRRDFHGQWTGQTGRGGHGRTHLNGYLPVPLIRYRVGGRAIAMDDAPCACGPGTAENRADAGTRHENFVRIDALRCPATGAPVHLIDAAAGNGAEITTGRLATTAGREYQIVDGIPIVLVPETFARARPKRGRASPEVAPGPALPRGTLDPTTCSGIWSATGSRRCTGLRRFCSAKGASWTPARPRARRRDVRAELVGDGVRHRHLDGHPQRVPRPQRRPRSTSCRPI